MKTINDLVKWIEARVNNYEFGLKNSIIVNEKEIFILKRGDLIAVVGKGNFSFNDVDDLVEVATILNLE